MAFRRTSLLCFFQFLLYISFADNRIVELKRIKNYELIHFDIYIDHNGDHIIEFDAFKQHYIVELIENQDMIPSNVFHTNGIPHDKIDSDLYFTASKTSCHYYGKVLNDHTDPLQRVSLSLCDKRGVRGEIRAFNETLVIKPSKYYLDIEYDNNNFHSLTDEHLVWRYCDFNFTGLPDMKHIDDMSTQNELSKPELYYKDNKGEKRRLVYNGGNNQVELLVLSDPEQTKYYYETYGGSWYDQLHADTADYVNSVSSKYYGAGDDLNRWNVGYITVSFVEFEVIWEFTGWYAGLFPGCLTNNFCGTWDGGWCSCELSGTDYLDRFANYIKTYKDQSTFDNAQLITKYYFNNGAGGWGFIGVICQTSNNVANLANNYGVTFWQTGAAHEMGHNFGAHHDGEGNDCPSGQGMMGGENEGFSECSLKYISTYFWENDGLSCLGTGVRGFKSNYGDDDGGDADDPDTGDTDTGGGDDDGNSEYQCVGIYNLEQSYNTDFNGYWYNQGDYDGNDYYTKDGWYLFYKTAWSLWIISTALDGGAYVYCASSSLSGCYGGQWHYVSDGWTSDADASVYDCGAGDDDGGDDDNNVGDCTYYNCIGLYDMQTSWDKNDLNKYYYPQGCHNGYAYYKSEENVYLYRTSGGNWNVYSDLDESYAYVYCSGVGDEVTACSNSMRYYDGSAWQVDDLVYVWQCDGQGFNAEVDCDNIDMYGDGLCVTNGMNGYYNGTREWSIVDDACENDMPVFHWEDPSVNTTFYLHYQESTKYTDSNETYGEWILSKDDILTSEYGYCEKEDLMDCVDGLWYIIGQEDTDALGYVNAKNMSVHQECINNHQEENEYRTAIIVMTACLVIALLLAGGFVGFYMYRNFILRSKMDQIMVAKETVDDESDNDDPQEIEVEVPVNTTR